MPIEYIHRTNREGYKAGALENGLRTSQGEFVAIFDADFLPEADFLRRTIPYFMNPEGGAGIGMVQTRWTYLNSDYSLLTNVETILLDGHFVVEHGARSRRGTFFNFNGTAGVWRRTAIEQAGGKVFAGPGRRVMDIQPTAIHQRTPVILGGTDQVALVLAHLEKH